MRMTGRATTIRTTARIVPVLAVAALAALGACGSDANGSGGGDSETPPPEEMPPPAPTTSAVVVSRIEHDTSAFTQGLVFLDGRLYESTGQYGRSSVRRLDPETGAVLQKVEVGPEYFAEGLAAHGGRLHQITWREQAGFIYDPATLARVGNFTYDGEGWGLASDGQRLVLSDGSDRLRFLDGRTFAPVGMVRVTDGGLPVTELNELEWVRGEIWANVWKQDRIARIDPRTGRVKGWLDVSALLPPDQRVNPEAVPNGIAYDERSNRLYLTGKLWPAIFRVELPADLPGAVPAAAAAAPDSAAKGAGTPGDSAKR